MAVIAVSTDAKAVIISTTSSGSTFFSSSRTSSPPISGSITSTMAASKAALAGEGQALVPVLGERHVVAGLARGGCRRTSRITSSSSTTRIDSWLIVTSLRGLGLRRRAGRATWKVVPLPGALSTKIAPPCSWTMP